MGESKDLSSFRKLNVGCGNCLYPDYLNIGYWKDIDLGAFGDVKGDGAYLLNWDLSKGIPVGDGSVDFLYSCHFMEHLDFEEAYAFLEESFRCLSSNGLMRVVVPDLKRWVRAYLDDDYLIERYREECMKGDERYSTPALVFMGMLHGHGHRFGWDFESIFSILSRIGFVKIRQRLYQESDMEDILDVERTHPLRALESVVVECRKA